MQIAKTKKSKMQKQTQKKKKKYEIESTPRCQVTGALRSQKDAAATS